MLSAVSVSVHTCILMMTSLLGIREWFRWYKSPDGKMNRFGFEERYLNKQETLVVIEDTHNYWSKLRTDGMKNKGKLWTGQERKPSTANH
jgi:hypothetical protein